MITNSKIYNSFINPKLPITADIFLTDFCNNKCCYCNYDRYAKKANSYIKFDDFILYANRLLELGIKSFILTGGGEPTLNPDFDKISNWLENNNIEYGINTNFNIYKEISPVYLKISLDAWNTDSYINKRGVDMYENVISNIIKYNKFRNKNKTQLVIQCLAESVLDISNFYNYNKFLDVDYIVFRPIESLNGQFYKEKDSIDIKNCIIDLAAKDKRILYSYKWDMLNKTFDKCFANYAQIAVDSSGMILSCCQKPFEKIGHILDENILEKKNKFNINMQTCDIPCRLSGPNLCLEQLTANSLMKDKNFI